MFLANTHNKTNFIAKLSQNLNENGIRIVQSIDDADTLIVNTAITLSETVSSHIYIVGEDIDLLVLAISLGPAGQNISLLKPNGGKKPTQIYSISLIKSSYVNIEHFILFSHAVGGCDTTSALFRVGKTKFFKLLIKNKSLQRIASLFYQKDMNQDEIEKEGDIFLLTLYKASDSVKSLNDWRIHCFRKTQL